MTVFTEAQARERLDAVLDQATVQGPVRIRRDDGREFLLSPVPTPPPRRPSTSANSPAPGSRTPRSTRPSPATTGSTPTSGNSA